MLRSFIENKRGLCFSLLALGMAYFSIISIGWYIGAPPFSMPNMQFLLLPLFIILCVLFKKPLDKVHKRQCIVCICGALLLGAFMSFGLMVSWGTSFGLIITVYPGFFSLAFMALAAIFAVADNFLAKIAARPAGEAKTKLARFFYALFYKQGAKCFLMLFALILILWLPAYILCFPGLATNDALSQMQQALGVTAFTAHHPPMHTAFFSLFLYIGKAVFGSYYVGIAIATTVQALALAALAAYTLRFMAGLGMATPFLAIGFLFYTVLPFYSFYAMTLWKDIWLAAFMLLFVIFIVKIIRSRRAFFSSYKNNIALALVSLGLVFSKNNAIFIFAITCIVLVIALKHCRLQLLAFLAGTVLVSSIITGPVYSALGIEKGDLREALSLPILQVGKVVTIAGSELSAEDINLISAVLPYEQIPELYDYKVSDSLKGVFSTPVFMENLGSYASLWLRLGLEHPDIYTLATLEHTIGYWYPDVDYWIIAYTGFAHALEESAEAMSALEGPYPDPMRPALQSVLSFFTSSLRKVPVVSVLFSVGFYFWVLLICGLYLLYRKAYTHMLLLVPLVVVWLTCLASPVFAEFRYAWPAIVCVPLVLGLSFGKKLSNLQEA